MQQMGRPGRCWSDWGDELAVCHEARVRVRKLVCLGMAGLLLAMLGWDPLLALAVCFVIVITSMPK